MLNQKSLISFISLAAFFAVGSSFMYKYFYDRTSAPLTSPVPYSLLIQDTASVQPIHESKGINPFYTKCLSASGILIMSSDDVDDAALLKAKSIVLVMLSRIPQVKQVLIDKKVKVAILSASQVLTDIPEYHELYKKFPGTDWNKRARGLGPTQELLLTSCGEENLLCSDYDLYKGESILVHEFAHAISFAIKFIEPNFNKRLMNAYSNAESNQLWRNTYAIVNAEEYFAEGVQCWFDANIGLSYSNGIHNEINTQEELRVYDPLLYNLICGYFYSDLNNVACEK